jgi:hypothetical protein
MEHLRGIGGSGGWLLKVEVGLGAPPGCPSLDWAPAGPELSISPITSHMATEQRFVFIVVLRFQSRCSEICFPMDSARRYSIRMGRDQTNRGRKLQNAGSFSQKKIEVNGNGGSIMSEPFSG